MSIAPRRMLILGSLATLILFLITAHYMTWPESSPSAHIGKLATSVGDRIQELLHTGDATTDNATGSPEKESEISVDTPPENAIPSEKGDDQVGHHDHVRPSPPITKDAGIKGCEYPMVIHVTPDAHCTGTLALYGSIVRNVLLQPEELQNKTCVHFTYVEPTLKTIEAMYKWPARKNPFTHVPDCAALDTTPTYNDIVPVRWQALAPIEKPAIMEAGLKTWVAALNKVHSWGMDLYPRILILDADSIIITDVHLIFQETLMQYTIAGAPDQFQNCNDRSRLNGGMILLRPSRYFHISTTELLYDPNASCASGKWSQSEQELLNCICGYNTHHPLSPEFPCTIMPIYNSVWPKNYGCSGANVVPMRSIHYTAAPKPWTVKEKQLDLRFDTGFWHCVRDATRAGNTTAVKKCNIPDQEVTRKVVMGGHYV